VSAIYAHLRSKNVRREGLLQAVLFFIAVAAIAAVLAAAAYMNAGTP